MDRTIFDRWMDGSIDDVYGWIECDLRSDSFFIVAMFPQQCFLCNPFSFALHRHTMKVCEYLVICTCSPASKRRSRGKEEEDEEDKEAKRRKNEEEEEEEEEEEKKKKEKSKEDWDWEEEGKKEEEWESEEERWPSLPKAPEPEPPQSPPF